MAKFIIGTKQHMTQVFTEDGRVHPATIISVGSVVVTQIKDENKDGYNALQVGYGSRNKKNINKAQQGHFKKLGDFRYVREFRSKEENNTLDLKVGDKIEAST